MKRRSHTAAEPGALGLWAALLAACATRVPAPGPRYRASRVDLRKLELPCRVLRELLADPPGLAS
jgi:hypothetical protein